MLGVLATIGVGTLLGFLNGAVITAFNVHPFIITLGTMAVYRGIAFVQTGGQSIGGFPAAFRQFVRWEILPDLSLVPLIVMIVVTIIGGIFLGAGSSGDGQGYELNAIAAAVVGGVSLVVGKGTALGAFLGAVILQMISNGLVILNIPQNYSQIVIGVVVITAVVLDQLNTWATKRRMIGRTCATKKGVVKASDAPVSLKPKTTS